VTEVSNQASLLSGKGNANPELWQQGYARAQYERAAAEVQNARARLESGTKTHSAGDFNEAAAAAERARTLLVTFDNTLSTALYARLSTQNQQRDVEQVLGTADGYDRSIESKKASLTPALIATRQQGRDAMNRAREQMNAGVKASNTAALTESRAVAQDAVTRLKSVLDELTRIEHDALVRQLADAEARGREAFALVDGAVTNFERLSAARPGAAGPDVLVKRDAIQKQITAARRRFDAAVKAESLQGVVDATRIASTSNGQLNEIISTFGPLTLVDRGVHPALIEGARLFLAGQYEEALNALNPPEGFAPELPLQLHVHLFKAAAAYALFVRSGETNQMLREQTIAEIEQCKQIDSSFQPDQRVFTPRFIGVFHTGTVASGTAATAAGSRQ
jgi:tetratricopeptide (TPR) repeat protein